jgi:thiol-disulfide isomerase/thioredoxin
MNLRWTSLLLLAGLAAAPALAAVAQDPAPVTRQDEKKGDDEKKPKVLKVGSVVPERLSLPDLDGKQHSFKDLRGKVVVLHFWSDRCPYEEHGNPVFARMEKRYADAKDVVMIGINSNQNELGRKPEKDADHSKLYGNLREKLAKAGLSHTMLADHGNVVSELFQARTTPHCFVIDPKGVIQYAGALDNDPRGEKGDDATNYVVEAVTAVQAGERPATTETKPYGCSIKKAKK